MKNNMPGNIKEIGQRIGAMREIRGMSIAELAEKTDVTAENLMAAENGDYDYSVTFVYKCAEALGVDLVELLTGDNPKLKRYSVIRSGEGLPMSRRAGFEYQHMAYLFKNKKIEPFVVNAPFSPTDIEKPISLSVHDGQEFDFILEGTLKMSIDGKTKELNPGDAIIYDSSAPHGMIAVSESGCKFLAILIK
jgi:transcriptional regulator with XRE-family HTH domain